MADNYVVEGLKEQQQRLDQLLASNPDMEKRVQDIIRKILKYVRKDISEDIGTALADDPRKAYRAVKTAVYRRILGGSVSILNKRRSSGKTTSYEPPRTLRPGQRGGNRVPRGQRTQQVMSYDGIDRAFILRFVNSGTTKRTAGSRGGKLSGNREDITGRNFFGPSAQRAMTSALADLENEFNTLFREMA